MRFLVQSGTSGLERARPPVRAFLAFALILLVSASAQRFVQGSLNPSELELTFSADNLPKGPFASTQLWEEVHGGSILYAVLLLTLGSLLVVCPVSPRLRNALIGVALGAALGDLLLPFAAGHLPGWAWLRVASFGIAVAALVASAVIVWTTFGKKAAPHA